MNNKFKLLECNDDDVVSFNGNLVKFAKLKSDLENEFKKKVNHLYGKEDQRAGTVQRIYSLIYLSFGQCDLTINLSSPKEGKECEILRLGAKSWQKGKLRTQAFIEFFPNTTEKAKIQFILEFSPDEPEITQPESPLDDIRRMINEVST
ncbi:MAG: hypothetical protein KME31_08885 [Tolypothrix carrinoi HA7290-LM1]|jgi:hypothetical protein|nr:hypothetical protein [Tolypothrix carrinoi HA7290-LM1]